MHLIRYLPLALVTVLAVVGGVLTAVDSPWWLLLAVPAGGLTLLGMRDLVQPSHSILRNYPIIAHLRYAAEDIRPEIQQYFVEAQTDGRPFDREVRKLVYQRAKATDEEEPFGTERDLYEPGAEFLLHSMAPLPDRDPPHVRVGGPACDQPYDLSLLNVSAMSFGSLSGPAIEALNKGAAMGGFAHDTGEGGISVYHRRPGGDLIWEIGSAYFGCRTHDGRFDRDLFADQATDDQVRMVELKLSQGAKPGLGGVMPAKKVTREIADARGVPVGEKCVSPPYHVEFDTPVGLLEMIAEMRELSGGKPAGFKLCIGRRHEFLAVCKAMLETGITPDFIVVDGSEGGTGAGPQEYLDHVGLPLTEGLVFVHNALVGVGLRDQVRIGASGKVAKGSDIVRRLAMGADFTNAARAMMFALGCIQAQTCHTNTCPVGVATQDPLRTRALVVDDKAQRVRDYHARTVATTVRILASMGMASIDELGPQHVTQRDEQGNIRTLAELFRWLEPDELVAGADDPEWRWWWELARPDAFRPAMTGRAASPMLDPGNR